MRGGTPRECRQLLGEKGISTPQTQITCQSTLMARQPRIDLADHIYHVVNRANGKVRIFHNDDDYRDFEYLLNEIRESYEMRVYAYCIMPNHWHLLLSPIKDGDLGKALHWLTTSHVRRHHARKNTVGQGHIYQGTYKSFLVAEDHHFLTVLKYVERNAVRAKLSARAEEWPWGSAHRRIITPAQNQRLLAPAPVDFPRNYIAWINDPEPAEVLKDVRSSVEKGISYGMVYASH